MTKPITLNTPQVNRESLTQATPVVEPTPKKISATQASEALTLQHLANIPSSIGGASTPGDPSQLSGARLAEEN